MDDPLRPLREDLAARLAALEAGGPQADLFQVPGVGSADEVAPSAKADADADDAPGDRSIDPAVAWVGRA
jgi:hypothetical protein